MPQVVVNAGFNINGDSYDGLTYLEKKALEVAANASLSTSYRIWENGKVLKDLVENGGVILPVPTAALGKAHAHTLKMK